MPALVLVCVGRVIGGICDVVCLCVCVRAVKEKRFELLIPHLADISVARLVLTLMSKGERPMSHGYQMRCQRGSAGRYDCLGF